MLVRFSQYIASQASAFYPPINFDKITASMGIFMTCIGVGSNLVNVPCSSAWTTTGSSLAILSLLRIYFCSVKKIESFQNLTIQKALDNHLNGLREFSIYQPFSFMQKGSREDHFILYPELLENRGFEYLTAEDKALITLFAENELEGLGECACEHSLRNRVLHIRSQFEDEAVCYLGKVSLKKRWISIAFFASGFLFGEFIIVYKLLEKLYEREWKGLIEINLMDKIYDPILRGHIDNERDKKVKKALETFQEALIRSMSPFTSLLLRVHSNESFMQHGTAHGFDAVISIEPTALGEEDLHKLYPSTLFENSLFAALKKIGTDVIFTNVYLIETQELSIRDQRVSSVKMIDQDFDEDEKLMQEEISFFVDSAKVTSEEKISLLNRRFTIGNSPLELDQL